jgi:hypothetical protein
MVKATTEFDSSVAGIGPSPSLKLMSRGKRCAAAAGSGCVRVGEFKAAAIES